MVKTKLGWKKAKEHARNMIESGQLTREQHLAVFEKFKDSSRDQDHSIAMALLREFIRKYPEDFDRDVSLDKLIEWGKKIARERWGVYGREIFYPIMKVRELPAVWIDKIADEEPFSLRLAFIMALKLLARLRKYPLDRLLGMIMYFIDDPDRSARIQLVNVFAEIAKRDSERLHYFLKDHESGAGSHRRALIHDTRKKLGWK